MGRGAKQKAGEESEAGCGFWWMQLTNFTQIVRHRNPHAPIICVWEREVGGSGRRDQSILRSNLYRSGPLQMQRFGAGGGEMLEVMKCCQHVAVPTGAGAGKLGHCICLFIFYNGPGQRTHFGWRCLHLHAYPLGQSWWAAKTGCYFWVNKYLWDQKWGKKLRRCEAVEWRNNMCWFMAAVYTFALTGSIGVGMQTASELGRRTESSRSKENEWGERLWSTVLEYKSAGGLHFTVLNFLEAKWEIYHPPHSLVLLQEVKKSLFEVKLLWKFHKICFLG